MSNGQPTWGSLNVENKVTNLVEGTPFIGDGIRTLHGYATFIFSIFL